ncbi:MAG: zf-HC2 domain-containing protein [Rhodocyclaceae bacterium]|nr:zf-HC2 domain-containing protein [Rhodocyclaceae bacterium]
MLSCKDVTHLLSEAQDRKLALSERLSLEMHLAMCKGCANFKKQMSFLRKACRGYADRVAADDVHKD